MTRNREYAWFILSNAPGFGAKSIYYIYHTLLANQLTISDLLNFKLNDLQKHFPTIGKGKFSRADFSCFAELTANDNLNKQFEKLEADGISIIGLDDERYPNTVFQNMGDNAPPILYCKGNLALLNQKSIAIVGVRDADDFDSLITKKVAQKFAENGINVTSGYANGVDTAAHVGALEAQNTTTLVLSYGMNHMTIKKEMDELNWQKNALFVSQFVPNKKFTGQQAAIRNILICALSEAVVVIKSGPEKDNSGKMSGTFNCGKSALKMGIPVFVLSPYTLKSPAQGNADLIKLGGIEFNNEMEILQRIEKHPPKKLTLFS